MASKMLAIDCYNHGKLDLDLAETYARQELGDSMSMNQFSDLCYNIGMTTDEARSLSIRLFGSDKIGAYSPVTLG